MGCHPLHAQAAPAPAGYLPCHPGRGTGWGCQLWATEGRPGLLGMKGWDPQTPRRALRPWQVPDHKQAG